MSSQDPDEERAELVTFQVKAACIYTPLPQATTYGHRAETWDVENFFREVRVRVVSVGDNLYIRLEDLESGELFAECPLPNDGSPLTRAVEPVVDSSRYYVLRVVDRADEKKHAFLGLGFRERGESSAFSAALDDYRIFLRRKAEAEAMRVAFEQGEETPGSPEGGSPSSSSGGSASGGRRLHSSGSGGGGVSGRFALPAGQTISLKLPGANNQGSKSPSLGERSGSLEREDNKRQVTRVFSLNETIAGVRLLPPPPGAGLGPRQASGIPPALADWAVFADAKDPLGQELMKRASGEVVKLSEVEGEEETWGEFQATA